MKNTIATLVVLMATTLTAFPQQTTPATPKDALPSKPEMQENNRKLPWSDTKSDTKKTEAIPAETVAKNHIQSLKNGVLLVRLRTQENAIQKLEDAGNEQMAATLKRRQDAENKRLIAAFQQHFTFCPVYFFFSSFSEDIEAGNFTGAFINENLETAPNPEIKEMNFYVAEITDLEQYRPDPEDPNVRNNAEISFRALVVRDNKFDQLTKPFPFFIKASQNIPPRKRSEPEMVILLNDNLHAFYKSAMKRR